MKKATLLTLILVLMAGCVVSAGSPPEAKKQAQPAAPQGYGAEDKTAPSYDMKPQAILDLQQLQERSEEHTSERFRRRNTRGGRPTACARCANYCCIFPGQIMVFRR